MHLSISYPSTGVRGYLTLLLVLTLGAIDIVQFTDRFLPWGEEFDTMICQIPLYPPTPEGGA